MDKFKMIIWILVMEVEEGIEEEQARIKIQDNKRKREDQIMWKKFKQNNKLKLN